MLWEKKVQITESKPNVKPATNDEASSWQDYKSHFDTSAMLKNCNKQEKGLY